VLSGTLFFCLSASAKAVQRLIHPPHNSTNEIDISPDTNPCIALKGKIPGLLHLEVRIDFLGPQQSTDVVLHAGTGKP